ncbi:MAG: sensor histidine kinase [Erysipelotrichaceae bacterium]
MVRINTTRIETTIAQLSKRIKIGQMFTLFIFVGVFVPVCFLYQFLFQSMNELLLDNKKIELQHEFEQMTSRIEKTNEMTMMVTQLLMNNTNINAYLSMLAQGQEIPLELLSSVYENEVSAIEKIVLSNPNLHQVRIFINQEQVMEMVPVFYQRERLQSQHVALDANQQSQWVINYTDEIFPKHIANPTPHVMGLFTKINDIQGNEIGVIEVSVLMKDVFPEFFQTSAYKKNMMYYQDTLYYDSGQSNDVTIYLDDILRSVDISQPKESLQEVYLRAEGFFVSSSQLRMSDASIIQVVSMQEVTLQVNEWGMYFAIALLFTGLLLLLIIHTLVKMILQRFYTISSLVQKVQDGNINDRLQDLGGDEVGVLGKQINLMLDRNTRLMKESINGEVLKKNSEIRALQNQINAHFIYNVLESIKMMAEIDEKYEISDAITSLGKLLRYSMKWTHSEVSVKEEIQYIQNYLSLLNLRYEYTISLHLEIEPSQYLQKIPKMSLQPIVENAVIHGIEDVAMDSMISVRAKEQGDDFLIEIADYGKGMSEVQIDELYDKISGEIETSGGSGNGIGLKNVQDRIHIAYGDTYGLTVASSVGQYTKVIMKIPKKRGR